MSDDEDLPRPPREWRLRFKLFMQRLSGRSPTSWWLHPARYAHELESDDFWILAGRWDTYCRKIAPRRIHPLLGWSQGPVTEDNPLGLVPETIARLVKDGRPKVLCFGDSYVDGPVERADKLPVLLDEMIPHSDVINLGVGGYGPGQMHLLCREVLPLVERPTLLLFGLEQFSFDRAGLGVRSYQKPRLVPRADGGLDVTNVPIDPDPEHFFREAKLELSSYRRAALRMLDEPPVTRDFGFDDKVAVNRALLAANQRMAREAGCELLYVIFQDHPQLAQPDRRSAFFMQELEALGIPAVDLGPVLRAEVERRDTDGSELFAAGHLNADGNRLAADAILPELKRLGFA